MFRIRRIYDDVLPINRDTLSQVKDILKGRFSSLSDDELDSIGDKLRNPFKHRFRLILFVAENARAKVLGLAMLLYEPQINFAYLDWLATNKGLSGGGAGGALYERVREEARALGVRGLFFECLPDDPEKCPGDKAVLKENRARLRFYENYGARPIINTEYESPVSSGDTCMPHLVVDGLGSPKNLKPGYVRKVVRAILERKYKEYCSPEYVAKVTSSIRDNPVQLREFRYLAAETAKIKVEDRYAEQIALVVNEQHNVHHVHERGYVESPVRVSSILSELEKTNLFSTIAPQNFSDKHIYAVHDADFVNYIRRACSAVPEGKSLYPYVFPLRNKLTPPKEKSVLAGYFCMDTFTPLNRNAFPTARRGVDCALTAAKAVIDGRRIAYALIRPPGHHAERRTFGGFCYFNNNAVAAHYLSSFGRVAILDIDYHHGNGQQDIFYCRSDVLTISIHGHPKFAYPYFTGFEHDHGEGDGEGYNLNLALPETVNGEKYRKHLTTALERIKMFDPVFLVVALGLDTAKGDPTGTWSLTPKDFEVNGRLIGELNLPTVVIQEGGYRTRTLGHNAQRFFSGLAKATLKPAETHHYRTPPHGITFRFESQPEDIRRIHNLINATGFFYEEEVKVAVELVQEQLNRGEASGYYFIYAEQYGRLAAYSCYGPIACTASAYDLYWIAVNPDLQGRGLGKKIIRETEKRIRERGGTRIYVETSQRVQYAGTRAFYERCGYQIASVLEDFYAPGEARVTYCKAL